ncbi:hypothetical protein [Nodosilinea nodulosa]|uniref:hypothetical protein n=1 Tax=Nodosilinea nodulosa TaxID=416001 RepID=UPI0002F76690|nr:hypothetical protein [Nodosilinea nodulosa]
MKRVLVIALVSLLFTQGIAWAQTAADDAPEPETTTLTAPPPVTFEGDTQAPIIPLKGTEQIQLRLVNCSWALDCFLAQRLLPASAHLNQLELRFDNPTTAPATILNTAVVVQGNLTQYPLSSQALALPNETITLPPQAISSIPLTLDRSAMPPEQYVGAIYLTQAAQSNRLVLPINLSVRSGPLLPIVIILLGVLLGRLVKYMQEVGGPQAEIREKVYRLEADIKALSPGDRQILRPMVAETRKLVYRQQLEAADAQVTLIQSRLAVLKQLRVIEDQLYDQQKQGDVIPPEAWESLQKARNLLAQGKDDEATTVVASMLQSASAQSRGSADPAAEQMGKTLLDAAVNLDKSARNAIAEAETPPPLTKLERVQQFFVALVGLSDQARAEATYWFVRPLLYLVLLIGLTIVGLNTLYIEQGEFFGARPMADYLVLLLWGLSADVASRSLTSLQGQ